MPGLGVVEVSWTRGAGTAVVDVFGCQSLAAPGWESSPAWPLPPAQPTRQRDRVRWHPGVGMGTIRGDEGTCGLCAGTKQVR